MRFIIKQQGFKNQQGVAIISVLVIVAVIAGLATQMSIRQQRFISTSTAMVDYQTQFLLSLSIEAWAKNLLIEDLSDNKIDIYLDKWSSELEDSSVGINTLSGQITDEQAKININNLINHKTVALLAQFNRLFEVLNLEKSLLDGVIDYLDKDSQVYSNKGAENDYYTQLENPYFISNMAMTDLSELRLIKGFNNKIITQLSPYIWAGGVAIKTINVNTAPKQVLKTLGVSLNEKILKLIQEKQVEEGFASVEGFVAFVKNNDGGVVDKTLLTTSSQYFLLQSQVDSPRSGFKMQSHIYRQAQGQPSVKITRRVIN